MKVLRKKAIDLQVSFCFFFLVFSFSGYSQNSQPEVDLAKEPYFISLKKALKHPESVYKLRLCSQQLKEFPLDICKLTNLRILYLDSNLIASIPPQISELKQLSVLSLDSNQISELPNTLFELASLRVVYLDRNNMTSLSPKIGQLFNLRTLSIHGNKIKELPLEIGSLKELRILDGGNNQLKRIPDEFGHLFNLERLSFAGNNLKKLPPHFYELCNLELLFLSENNFSILDSSLYKLKKVEVLALDKNQLTAVPAQMGTMYSLKKLYLEQNAITAIPDELGSLFNLQVLNIDDNPLKTIPPSFKDLKKLERLYVENCNLQPLPAVLFDMQRNGTDIKGLKTKELFDSKLLMSKGRNKKLTENYAEAIEKFEELLKIDTNNVEALSELAACYLENAEYDKAAATCKKALSKDPSIKTLGDIQVTMSNAQNKTNKLTNISAFYEEKIAAEPKNAQPIFEYGKYMYLQNKNEEAKKIFERAINLDPNHAYSQFYLAVTNLALNKKDLFVFSTLRYLILEPKTNKSVTILPFLLTKMGMKTGIEKKKGSKSYYDSYIIRDENNEVIYKSEDPKTDQLVAMFMDLLANDLSKSKSTDSDSTKAIKKLVSEMLDKNNVEVFSSKLETICQTPIDSIPQNDRESWDYYLPYYTALISNDHLEAFSYIINAIRHEDEYIVKWIKANPKKVQAFYEWDRKYKWH